MLVGITSTTLASNKVVRAKPVKATTEGSSTVSPNVAQAVLGVIRSLW
jgi:hypothetical protein